jgi:septal ring factor EnvC (AmiA/AmiB activator)
MESVNEESLYNLPKQRLIDIIITLKEEKRKTEKTLNFSMWALSKLENQLDKNKNEVSNILEIIEANEADSPLTNKGNGSKN